MGYCLKSDEKSLCAYRQDLPINEHAKGIIQRASVLRLREAVLAHYEINPFLLFSETTSKKMFLNGVLSVQKEDEYRPEKAALDMLELLNIAINTPEQAMRLVAFLQSVGHPITPYQVLSMLGYDPKRLDFQTFLETADSNNYRLVDCFRRSVLAKEISYVSEGHLDELIRKEDYVKLFATKGLPLPEYMVQQVFAWEPPKLRKIEDIKKIDFNNLPSSVLAALGANAIAQAYKRANPEEKISQICNSKVMKLLLDKCAVAEGKDSIRAEDTIREYIEHQF